MSTPRAIFAALLMLASLVLLGVSLTAMCLDLVPPPFGVVALAFSVLTGWLAATCIDTYEG